MPPPPQMGWHFSWMNGKITFFYLRLIRDASPTAELTKAVKYTSLADVWAEIDYHAREGADKLSIAQQCMERWKRNGRPK